MSQKRKLKNRNKGVAKPSIVMDDADYQRMVQLQDIVQNGTDAERCKAFGEISVLMYKAVHSAAEAGNPEMMMKLAHWYDIGLHVDPNPSKAEFWRQRALKAGAKTDGVGTIIHDPSQL